MHPRLGGLLAMTLSVACGDDPCPAGTVPAGDVCVATDAGTLPDGATPDASGHDGGDDDAGPTCSGFADGDGDGHGAGAEVGGLSCPLPGGYAEVDDDCDDDDETALPGADEACDGADDDCDGAVDEGRLAPVGAPQQVWGVGGDRDSVAIDALPDGYAIAVLDPGIRQIYYQDVGNDGVVRRSGMVGATRPSGPSIRVTELSTPPRIMIAWTEEVASSPQRINARTTLLDDSGTSSIELVADVGTGYQASATTLARTEDGFAVAWAELTRMGGTSPVRVRRVNGATGAPVGGAVLVTRLEVRTSRPAALGIPGGLVVSVADDRAGDVSQVGYAFGLDAAADGTLTLATGMARAADPLDALVLGTALARTFEGDPWLGLGTNSGGRGSVLTGSPLEAGAVDTLSDETTVQHGDGTLLVGPRLTPSGDVVGSVFERSSSGLREIELEDAGYTALSTAISMRDPGHAAVVYSARQAPTGPISVRVQILECL